MHAPAPYDPVTAEPTLRAVLQKRRPSKPCHILAALGGGSYIRISLAV
ncbi:MAG: hypothetical protein JWO64_1793, partial [Hyphomicrobiales bacterium]|nr:hypothetical protein [Hyphomicrobiales bacterium]